MNGWRKATLGELAQIGTGNPAPQDEALFKGGTHPFFRTADAGRVRFGEIFEAKDYLNSGGIRKLTEYPKGTILFPKSGASTFLNHRVMLGVAGYVSSHLATIIADGTVIDAKFLLYFLSTVAAQDLVQDHSYPSLNKGNISGIEVTYPHLGEQRRIVAILDEAFAGLEAMRANAEKNLQNARRLFETVLADLFSGTEPSWVEKPISQLATKIGSGATPRGGKESYKSQGLPLIRSMNVHDRRFKYDDLAFLDDEQAAKLDNVTVEKDDVLLNITGASVARCCIVPDDVLPARVNQHVSIIRPKRAYILPRFLEYALTARPNKERLLGVGEKGGSTRQAITKAEIEEFSVRFPSIEAQARFIADLDGLGEETARLEAIYRQKVAAMDELRQSVLQKAFSGDLTSSESLAA